MALPICSMDFDLLCLKIDDRYSVLHWYVLTNGVFCVMWSLWVCGVCNTFKLVGNYKISFRPNTPLFERVFEGHNVSILNSFCHEAGVPLAEDKTVGPTTCLTSLGLEIDTFESNCSLLKSVT